MKRAAMKQAAMTSSLKPRPAFGVAVPRGKDKAGKCCRHAMFTKFRKTSRSALMPESFAAFVAADRVDLPADDGARRHEGVDYYQRRRDHQHTCGPSATVTIISN